MPSSSSWFNANMLKARARPVNSQLVDPQLRSDQSRAKGADLSLRLIFAGVNGGQVGLFVGPVVLAVGSKSLEAWMADGESLPSGYRD